MTKTQSKQDQNKGVGQQKDLKDNDQVKLDRKAQKALAYLSGIPSTDKKALVEVVPLAQEGKAEFERLLDIWNRFQEQEIREIGKTLFEILQCINLKNKKVRERIESPEYVNLVRKAFRNWSAAESELKRVIIRNLLVNATTKTTSPDYALAMFIDWINTYSDEHFMVIRKLYQSMPEGLTRKEIWLQYRNYIPPEDSAEADMFKMLILDLTTGYVIRQPREKDFYGRFVRTRPIRTAAAETGSQTVSAFEDTKKYVLTELGKQFVAYAMEEIRQQEEKLTD